MLETRQVKLLGNYVMDIQMTPAFVKLVKQHYGLPFDSTLSDDHLQRYVIEAMKVAVDGAKQ